MRNAIRILVLVLIAAGVYAYYQIPSTSDKELNEALAAISGATSDSAPGGAGPPRGAAPPAHAVPAAPALPKPTAPASAPPPDSTPSPPAYKPWTPPDVMPAQPNWTWTTLDGTTYNNVVVTKITPAAVSFTHAMGVAHDVPIANLPPEIQQKLNYDPVAAEAARKEARREEEHPFYSFADRAEAQAVARQLGWPLAWICTDLADLTALNPDPDSEADLSQRALSHLKSHVVIILANGNGELVQLPPLVLSQFFVMDDGIIPGGHHFYGPKIVLSDADVTKTYGRITHTQLIARGDAAFDEGLAAIPASSARPSPANSSTAAPAPVAAVAPASTPPPKPAPAPAPTTTPSPPPNAVTALSPTSDAPKPWAPPDVIPAQPNWTWTTLDGTTYQNVVITKIEPDTVSITHSLGVAHLPMNMLPRDLQKQLNYQRP